MINMATLCCSVWVRKSICGNIVICEAIWIRSFSPFRSMIHKLFKYVTANYYKIIHFFYVYLLYNVCIAVFTLDAGLLARSQYLEGPATGHLDTGFSWFPCVYKRMLRWFPSFQVATTCLSCSPPDLNFLVTFFSHLCTCKITTANGW